MTSVKNIAKKIFFEKQQENPEKTPIFCCFFYSSVVKWYQYVKGVFS